MEMITVILGFISLYIILTLARFANWVTSVFADFQANWALVLLWGLAVPLCIFALLRVRKKIRNGDTALNATPDPHIIQKIKICAGILLLYCLYEAYAIYNTLNILAHHDPLELELHWQPWDYLPMALQLALLATGAIALFRLKSHAVILFSAAAFLYLLTLTHSLIRHPGYLEQLGIILLFGMVKFGLPLVVSVYAWRKINPAQ